MQEGFSGGDRRQIRNAHAGSERPADLKEKSAPPVIPNGAADFDWADERRNDQARRKIHWQIGWFGTIRKLIGLPQFVCADKVHFVAQERRQVCQCSEIAQLK